MDDQNKNLILATVLSFAVLLIWSFFFAQPQTEQPPETAEISADAPVVPKPDATAPGVTLETDPAQSMDEALTVDARIAIETPDLTGSLSLTGGQIDDLLLTQYRTSVDEDAPLVRLFRPASVADAYYALHGWVPTGDLDFDAVPGPKTQWQVESGDTLGVGSPVRLIWDNGAGLIFRRQIEVDDEYMFTITQSVENTTGSSVRLAPYGIIARHGKPTDLKGFYILHEGVILTADGELTETSYNDIADLDMDPAERAATEAIAVQENGWIGFTDHYWMSTLIPNAGQTFTAVTKYTPTSDRYQTDMRLPVQEIAAGSVGEVQTRLFAGPKEWETIRAYEKNLNIDRFVDAIDWGWFFFLTKPIFMALHYLHALIGNMGVAIIALTLLIKALLFPLAYKSYVSMSKMKKLQPEMEKIKERVGDDRAKMQQEVMALYKKEKVNPAAGCLPILVQIPIFFSLYKVIFVTLELRQAPFFGWIRDLSAPDPSSILNLFGLLPFDAPGPGSMLAILSIGVWPILMGISMWLQMKLNPAPTDKTQAMIFNWMPLMFTFMLGGFASGLVIYWVANNLITFTQQFLIMRSQGVKPNILGNILGKTNEASKPD